MQLYNFIPNLQLLHSTEHTKSINNTELLFNRELTQYTSPQQGLEPNKPNDNVTVILYNLDNAQCPAQI